MACPNQAIAMSARLAPSTVSHVLRLVGSSYLDSGAGPSTLRHRARAHAARLVLYPPVRTTRRFASSAHALAEPVTADHHGGDHLSAGAWTEDDTVRTPKKGHHYDIPHAPLIPEWARIPKEAKDQLFTTPRPSPKEFRHAFDALERDPLFIIPVNRLWATFQVFSSPSTTESDWTWLANVLTLAKDEIGDRWEDVPLSESLMRALRGLALAHAGEYDSAAASFSVSIRVALKTQPSPDFYYHWDLDVLEAYMRLVREVERPEDIASMVRYAGPRLQKILSQTPGSFEYKAAMTRLRDGLHEALGDLRNPAEWLSTQLRPGPDGRPPRSVYHVALVLLATITRDSSRTADAFYVWRHIVQQFNSTIVPPATASKLASNLARAGHFDAAKEVFHGLRESVAAPPHSALSRELWTYAEAGEPDAARRVWTEIATRYGPTRDDRLALATAYAVTGDLQATHDILLDLFGGDADDAVDTLAILQRAAIASGDAEAAHEYLDKSIQIRPTIEPYLSLLNLHGAQGNIDAAVRVFDRLLETGIPLDTRCYTALISAFGKAHDYVNASSIFQAMIDAGHAPTVAAWRARLNAHVESGQWVAAADLCGDIPPGMMKDPALTTIVLKSFVYVAAPFNSILRLFRSIRSPSAAAWALVIQAAADDENLVKARTLFEEMDTRSQVNIFAPPPNVYVFSILLAAYLRSGDRDSARAVYDAMVERKIAPTSVTYAIIVSAYADSPGESSFEQAHNFAMGVLGQPFSLEKPGARGSAIENIFGPLITAAGRAGNVERAKAYYDQITALSGNSFMTAGKMMGAYRNAGDTKSLYRMWLRLFGEAKRAIPRLTPEGEDTRPGARSKTHTLTIPLSLVLEGLANAGAHNRIKSLWRDYRNAGFGFDAENYNHYAMALARTGYVEDAFRVVDRVLIPRADAVKDRGYRSMRPLTGMEPVDAAVVEGLPTADDTADDPTGDFASDSIPAAQPDHGVRLTNDDVAGDWHGVPNRRTELQPSVPPQFGDDNTAGEHLIDLDILRQWRPTDVLWRPTNRTISTLERVYRSLQQQLEDQRAYRAWIGIGSSDENDDSGATAEPITLQWDHNTTVKNPDGSPVQMSPKLLMARLNSKYARVVSLVMFHRRKKVKGRMKKYQK